MHCVSRIEGGSCQFVRAFLCERDSRWSRPVDVCLVHAASLLAAQLDELMKLKSKLVNRLPDSLLRMVRASASLSIIHWPSVIHHVHLPVQLADLAGLPEILNG